MSQDERQEKPSRNALTSRDIGAFVVSSQHKEVLWIFNLVAEQE